MVRDELFHMAAGKGLKLTRVLIKLGVGGFAYYPYSVILSRQKPIKVKCLTGYIIRYPPFTAIYH